MPTSTRAPWPGPTRQQGSVPRGQSHSWSAWVSMGSHSVLHPSPEDNCSDQQWMPTMNTGSGAWGPGASGQGRAHGGKGWSRSLSSWKDRQWTEGTGKQGVTVEEGLMKQAPEVGSPCPAGLQSRLATPCYGPSWSHEIQSPSPAWAVGQRSGKSSPPPGQGCQGSPSRRVRVAEMSEMGRAGLIGVASGCQGCSGCLAFPGTTCPTFQRQSASWLHRGQEPTEARDPR